MQGKENSRTAGQAECSCAYCCSILAISNQLWCQPTLSNPDTPTPSMGFHARSFESGTKEQPPKAIDAMSNDSKMARQITWVTSRLHCAARVKELEGH